MRIGIGIAVSAAVAGCGMLPLSEWDGHSHPRTGQVVAPGVRISEPFDAAYLPDGYGWSCSWVSARWMAEPGYMFVTVSGSSSCPNVAKGTRKSGDVVTIQLRTRGGNVCTTDMAGTTSIVAMPRGTDNGEPIQVRIGDHDAAEILTVMPRQNPGQVGPLAPPRVPIRWGGEPAWEYEIGPDGIPDPATQRRCLLEPDFAADYSDICHWH